MPDINEIDINSLFEELNKTGQAKLSDHVKNPKKKPRSKDPR